MAAGRLFREHRGVYAVGHPGSSDDARALSAVLAPGPRSLLSHRSAIHHFDLLDGAGPARVHVTAVGRTRDGHPGLVLHLPRRVTRAEATVVRGVPCTVARALADFAGDATQAELTTAVHRATVRGLIVGADVERQLSRRITGIGRLRAVIEPSGPDLREQLERAFAGFARRGGWPAYEANILLRTPLGPLRTDVLWRDDCFALELDSWRFHGSREAFETDRRRVIAADLIGLDLRRVTWRMLHDQPDVVRRMLDHHLGASRPSTSRSR